MGHDQSASGNLLPVLYHLDHSHWWSAGGCAIVMALLADRRLAPGLILEVGCGAGHLVRTLAENYPDHSAIGIDLHPLALAAAGPSASATHPAWFAQGDLHHLPSADTTCSLVIALDVLDQSGVSPSTALAEARRVLRQQGLLLARFSAHGWLEGPHDQAFGTAHRYTAHEVRKLLTEAGFTLLRLTHATALLFPVAVIVRLAERRGWLPVASELNTACALNSLLRATLQAEACWLRRHNLPAGLSLYALAQKQ
jgi:SAM-dependent methyltransferase